MLVTGPRGALRRLAVAAGTVLVEFVVVGAVLIGSAVAAIPAEASTAGLAPAAVGPDGRLAVSVVMPLTVPPGTEGLIPADELEEFTAPGGLLTRELAAVERRPIALGVDPRLLASIRVLGGDAPEGALAWLARLEASGNETFPLAYADADPVAAGQAGSGDPLLPLSFDFAIDPGRFAAPADEQQDPDGGSTGDDGDQAEDTESPLPGTPTPTPEPGALPPLPTTIEDLTGWDWSFEGIAWPGPSTVVGSDLARLEAHGYSDLMLSARDVSGSSGPLVGLTGSAMRGVVADDRLSAAARSLAAAATPQIAQSTADALRAELAAAAVDAGPASRVVTIDRAWPLGVGRLGEVTDAIAQSATTRAASLAEVLAGVATPAALVESPEPAARIQSVAAALAAATTEASFATVAQDPLDLTAPRRLDLLALLAVSWQSDDRFAVATSEFLERSRDILGGVQVVEQSDLLALGAGVPLPVTVTNSLDVPVRVFANARPLQPVLSIDPGDQRVEIEVPAGSTVKGSIPAEAIANGDVQVVVSLTTETGVPVGDARRLNVNVQAAWESVGVTIAVVLIVGVFAIGLLRNILRRRRSRSDAGPDADAGPSS